jgi:hypothetical protein
MTQQDQQIEQYLNEDQDIDFDQIPETTEEYYERQRQAYGLSVPPPIPPSPQSLVPPTLNRIPLKPKTLLPRPIVPRYTKKFDSPSTSGGLVTTRKRAAKPKNAESTIAKRSVYQDSDTEDQTIEGELRAQSLQFLINENRKYEISKKFYEIPEGEYLIHSIGQRVIHPQFGPFQSGFVEAKSDGTRTKLIFPKSFTKLPAHLRGNLIPPLAVYSKHLPGKQYTEIKFLG